MLQLTPAEIINPVSIPINSSQSIWLAANVQCTYIVHSSSNSLTIALIKLLKERFNYIQKEE